MQSNNSSNSERNLSVNVQILALFPKECPLITFVHAGLQPQGVQWQEFLH